MRFFIGKCSRLVELVTQGKQSRTLRKLQGYNLSWGGEDKYGKKKNSLDAGEILERLGKLWRNTKILKNIIDYTNWYAARSTKQKKVSKKNTRRRMIYKVRMLSLIHIYNIIVQSLGNLQDVNSLPTGIT